MKNQLDSQNKIGQKLPVANIPFNERDAVGYMGQVGMVAAGQVVQHGHPAVVLEKGIDEVRADKTGPAGDQNGSVFN